MIINHNMSAINSHRDPRTTIFEEHGKAVERHADKPRWRRRFRPRCFGKNAYPVAGLRQAERNTEDGMSMIQTTEGYLNELSELLQRIRVLSVQSSNGIYTAEDRQMMQVEVSQLVDEVDRIASQAEFNTMKLLQGDFARTSATASMWFHMGANMHQRERVFIATMTAQSLNMRTQAGGIESISTAAKANNMIGMTDEALQMVSRQRANLGAVLQSS